MKKVFEMARRNFLAYCYVNLIFFFVLWFYLNAIAGLIIGFISGMYGIFGFLWYFINSLLFLPVFVLIWSAPYFNDEFKNKYLVNYLGAVKSILKWLKAIKA